MGNQALPPTVLTPHSRRFAYGRRRGGVRGSVNARTLLAIATSSGYLDSLPTGVMPTCKPGASCSLQAEHGSSASSSPWEMPLLLEVAIRGGFGDGVRLHKRRPQLRQLVAPIQASKNEKKNHRQKDKDRPTGGTEPHK
ncbi:hypothetical protein PMIN01_07460 [Paraphaeosphaeria minitans]|uniref:Uncharacterized protein n=1 Tax=Paraphaeosphaeria minitans TaxID=565426 RepID=A0A9P6KPY3_9PLEO|nr:hypothetical protein PMIN01_07460 [Paraphaeosphaeria minitans]